MTTSLETLLKIQMVTIDSFDRFIINFKKCSKANCTLGYLNGRLDGITNIWKEFYENHQKIMVSADSTNQALPYFSNDTYSKYEELHYEYLGRFRDMISNIKSEQVSEANTSSRISENCSFVGASATSLTSVQLPPVQLPNFSGQYSEWQPFRDMFIALIGDNQSLSNVQKLHYLRSTVSGEADQLLRAYSICELNYVPAWEALLKRYENRRLLINAQMGILFNSKPITQDTASSIRNLYDATNESLASLQSLKVDVKNWDLTIIYIQTQRLPADTRLQWEQRLSLTTEPPTLSEYLQFLESRFRMLEAVIRPPIANKINNRPTQAHISAQNSTCFCCRQNHSIRKCLSFRSLPLDQKQQIVKGNNMCFNCLATDHQSLNCPSQQGCNHCGRRHHTLLHGYTPASHLHSNVSGKSTPVTSLLANHSVDSVLLSTALLKASSNGRQLTMRALIDTGSQVSFITTTAMQRLRLKPLPVDHEIKISGIGKTTTGSVQKVVQFEVGSIVSNDFTMPLKTLVLPSLTDRLPHSTLPLAEFKHLQNLELADPLYYQPGKIDILLGSDVYPAIIRDGLRRGTPNNPIAQNTAFGWILLGPISNPPKPSTHVHSFFNRVELDSQLRKFWELEEVESSSGITEDTIRCEKHFKATHKRDKQGRYIVALPFKTPPERLGSSYASACSQLITLERRLSRNPQLHADYHQCLNEYLMLKHMDKIPEDEMNVTPNYYMPHHGVVKETSLTTKVRVVFNASCKTDKGNSLNEQLYVGTRLQQDLPDIITRWRIYRVAFSADMEKMYRQVLITPADRDYQRILWRHSPSEPIQHYRLNTVTFGVNSAPFLALRAVQQLVEDDGSSFPLASKALSQELYVDNVLSGGENLTQATQLQQELIKLLSQGGFRLRQWTSNDPTVIQNVPEKDRLESETIEISETATSTVNALGLKWHRIRDELSIKFLLVPDAGPRNEAPTKRIMLSTIARLFDPLGWYAPVLITAKLLLQKLWLQNIEWDQILPNQIQSEWDQFRSNIPQLEHIKVPRWLYTTNSTQIELHGFCDASERAYAAVVYLRVVTGSSLKSKMSIVMSKTKVAPIKTVSLPRLELCGASLLAKLMARIVSILQWQEFPIHCWSDSTIVLAWLSKHPCHWKTFVANRSSQIHGLIPTAIWHHVTSSDNPADLATRGMTPDNLSTSTLWWKGPMWLQTFTQQDPTEQLYETTQEMRKPTALTTQIQNPKQLLDLTKFSSYNRLIRITAYCFRFIHNSTRDKTNNNCSYLTTHELKFASTYWYQTVQQENYTDEIAALKLHGTINKHSKIRALTPFLDQYGILRVGGRLQKAEITFDEQHPVILPHGSHILRLIIAHHHLKTLHGGLTATLNSIRKTYWAPKLRNSVKAYIHNCVKCFRLSKTISTQMMGNLPKERINPAPAFTNTGIDYAGPFSLRMSKGRGTKTYKGYIALFVCLATKAIHLEVVSDLTTEALLAALRRFIARRGLCKNIYSDCGTNFIGAKTILEKTFVASQKRIRSEVAELLATDGITWSFIPPASPHFGGLWEAGVRSVKHHLRRVVGNVILTYEEFATVLTQIEACLNSRPLSPLSDDPTELTPLTPGHFLIGRAITAPPQDDLLEVNTIGLRRWVLVQKLQQDFWKRWQTEYLHTLQQRTKWQQTQTNLKVGQLVTIKDERLPPLKWLMGRITETHPGPDGLVRVVDIKTAASILRRPIHKVCLLPEQKDTVDTKEQNQQ